MLELFTDGLQLKITKIATYKGKQKLRSLAYMLLLLLGISLLLLTYQFKQIKLAAFETAVGQTSIAIQENTLVATKIDLAKLAPTNTELGIGIGKHGLLIKNVGEISFAVLRDFSGSKDPQIALVDLLKKGQSDLKNVIFLTLYLRTLPFILLTLVSLMIVSYLLKKQVTQRQLTTSQAFEMVLALTTIPSILYFCLRAAGLSNAIALFIFLTTLVLLNFYYGRQLNSPEKEDT